MTLRANLEFAAVSQPRLERHRRANELLETFELSSVSERKPRGLSLSQRRCGSIARALMAEPRALLLDDPAQGLDPAGRLGIHVAVRRALEESPIPILLATRDLSDCCELAGQMLVLSAGRVLETGAPAKIVTQPGDLEVARLLGFENLFQAEIVALDPGRDSSRLRLENCEISGPYFPGRFRGDRVWLAMRAEELRALPREGAKAGPNQVVAKLTRVAILPRVMRLEFEGGLAAVCSKEEFERQRDNKEWLVEFPAESVRIV
jgi:ABC-type sulfate/molybdate transport systems ATPase subunit